ncbi:MAG: hypothetical protein SFU86_06200 [Pirellulaceae bacterium]|nr:hypothetical protein [Pirellulaceae bacterium]
MHKFSIVAAMFAASFLTSAARAAERLAASAAAGCSTGCNACEACGACGASGCDPCGACGCRGGLLGGICGHGHGGHGHHCRQQFEGQYPGFHCGCNGSYKFPVPPLYTYHWPGMYSAQLMTDYHSPWRFPPLKPYSDELPLVEMGAVENSSRATPVSTTPRVVGEIEPMSSRLLRQQR